MLTACSESTSLCYGIVAGSALWHGAYRNQTEPDTRTLSFHGQAIQAFRKDLSQPTATYLDSTILAAICLTHHQVLCRNKAGLKMHVDGIQALVNARGGLHNVGWLTHLILWIDYYTCLFVDQTPRFSWPVDSSIRRNNDQEELYGFAFETIQYKKLLEPRLRLQCINVCRVVELLESSTCNGSALPISVQDYYRYKRTLLGIELGQLHADHHATGTVDECVSLTLNSIVLKLFYMHVLDASRIDLCDKLRLALDRTGIKLLQQERPDLLIWMLFTAGALAPATWAGKDWFVGLLKTILSVRMASAAMPQHWQQYLRDVLQDHVWSTALLAAAFDGMVRLLQSVVVIYELEPDSYNLDERLVRGLIAAADS